MKFLLILLPVIVSCSKIAQDTSYNEIEIMTVQSKNWRYVCEDDVIKTQEGNKLTIAFDMDNQIIKCRE